MELIVLLLIAVSFFTADAVTIDFQDVVDWSLHEVDIDQRDANAPETAFYPEARSGHVFVRIRGTNDILLFGGIGGTYLDDTWLLHSVDASWEKLATAISPDPRRYSGFANVLDNVVSIYGGYGGPEYFDVWNFDYTNSSDPWHFSVAGGTHPVGRSSTSMWPLKDGVSSNGGFIVGGGRMALVERDYDPLVIYEHTDRDSGSWTSQATTGVVPQPCIAPAHWVQETALGDYVLWLFGGRELGHYVAHLYRISTTTWVWEQVFDDEGEEGSTDDLGPELEYEPVHPGGMQSMKTVTISGRTFLYGGRGYGDHYEISLGDLGCLWMFNSSEAVPTTWDGWYWIHIEYSDDSMAGHQGPVWSGSQRTPGQRTGLGVAAVGNTLFVYGGHRADFFSSLDDAGDLWSIDVTKALDYLPPTPPDPGPDPSNHGLSLIGEGVSLGLMMIVMLCF